MLIAIAALLGIVGIALAFSAFGALVRARLFRFVFSALMSVVLIAAGAVLAYLAGQASQKRMAAETAVA
jgi:hypothetical protein